MPTDNPQAPSLRVQIYSALCAGRSRLYDGRRMRANQSYHMCIAINNARDQGDCTPEAAELARSMIAARIHPFSTVGGWLRGNKHVSMDRPIASDKLQLYRRKWMAALIEEFEPR